MIMKGDIPRLLNRCLDMIVIFLGVILLFIINVVITMLAVKFILKWMDNKAKN